MRKIKHLLYTDGRGETAIIFPKMKSSKVISATLRNKNGDQEYEMKDVFTIIEPGHFNDQWHLPVTRDMMESLGARHKYDIDYDIMI
jgi:hypothetical protein